MSALSLTSMQNLTVYRELLGRGDKCATNWYAEYGAPGAFDRRPPDDQVINLGGFSRYAKKVESFTPIEKQLAALRAEKLAAKEEVEAFTKKTYPQYNPIPVSQASVNVWGDAAWHSQPKQAVGSPSSFNPYNMNNPTWVRRQWGIDHQSTSFIPAHVTTRSREFAEAFAAP